MPLRKVCGTTFNDLHPSKKRGDTDEGKRDRTSSSDGNQEGRRYGSEVCFTIVFRHAGPLDPIGDGKMGFVEVKTSGQKPRPLQLKRHAMLRRLGCQVFVLDAMEDIPAVLNAIARTPDGKGGGGA